MIEYLGWLIAAMLAVHLFWPYQAHEHRIFREIDSAPVPDRLTAMSVEQLLDATIDPHRELIGIEKALCAQCGCEYRDNSYTSEVVFHAVRDGHDWSEVMSLADEAAHWRNTGACEGVSEA